MARRVVMGRVRAACAREVADFAHKVGQIIREVLSGFAATQQPKVRFVEPLEDRRMLASVNFNDGVLSLSGNNGQRNTISVTKSGSNLVGKVGSVSKTVSAGSVSQIKIFGGDWNDTISISSSISTKSYIDGRAGNDKINGGSGPDTVWGDSGNDSIYGNGGNDSLYGEAGADYVDGGSGTNRADGGEGTDTVKNNNASTTPTSAPSTTSSIAVTSFQLWNTSTNKFIKTLNSGDTLNLANLPSTLTIIAKTSGSTNSVKFGLDSNSTYRKENGAPWSISGDVNNKPVKWNLPSGTHTIKATPYTKTNATGTAGATKSITLTITNSSSSQTPPPSNTTSPPPPPTSGGSTSSGGGISPRDNSASAPNAVISAVSSRTIHAGQSFHANAMSSQLKDGTPLTARYVWDFDDSGSRFNILQGFNAAHYYDTPGTYNVKLTLTNEAGKTDTVTTTVTVLSAGRKKIFVSNDGSDSNDGLSESKPLKTFSKAISKAGDNVEILFKGGDTFDTTKGLTTYARNFVVGSYGSGRATIRYTGPRDYTSIFYLGGGPNDDGEATIRDLVFDSTLDTSSAYGLSQSVSVGGRGNTVINCEFRRVGYAVNAQAKPNGLLVQDSEAPMASGGLRDYFVWASGKDITILGNYVKNVNSHVVRVADLDRINIAYNDFSNPDESAGIRGTLTIHKGSYAYVAGNKLQQGKWTVGPLGNADGMGDKGARWNWSVFENNIATDTRFIAEHGAQHTIFRNNVLKQNTDWPIEVEGFNGSYNRGVSDLTIVNNTAINNSSTGNFIKVGNGAVGINLVNNLWLAPNLKTGTTGAAPVFVYDNDLSAFNRITGNVWPSPSIEQYAEGGINYVWPSWSNADGYRTPAEWEAFSQVIKDYYQDTSFNSSTYAPSSSSQAASAGVVWNGVFTDMNGKVRSNSGSWTAGAIEV